MARILLGFNKPYGVLSQFRPVEGKRTLAEFIDLPGVHPAGRLDEDSEGLSLLTTDGALQHRLTDPKHKVWKRYLVQVENTPDNSAVEQLRRGVVVQKRKTLPAKVKAVEPPAWLWPREPPIRFRRHIPTAWLEISIREGRNRQVRRMTAAVGYPTLRLIRIAAGGFSLKGISPGSYKYLSVPKNINPTSRRTR